MDHDLKGQQTGPLDTYQWSAVKLASLVLFVKRLLISAAAVLLTVCLVVIVWAAIAFGSELSTVEHNQQANQQQAQQYHQDSITANASLQCETKALDQILTELASADQAKAAHETPSPFIYPKPC